MTVPREARRFLIALALYRRENECGPTWSELAAVLNLKQPEVGDLAWALRRSRMVSFTRQPRSIRVTRAGLDAAVGKEEARR